MGASESHYGGKIAQEWASKLLKLPPTRKVRAILLLVSHHGSVATGRRLSDKVRSERVAAVKAAAESSLPTVDLILKSYGGRRLADSVDALGTVPVETTPRGLLALADSEIVQAVLEDQPLLPLRR